MIKRVIIWLTVLLFVSIAIPLGFFYFIFGNNPKITSEDDEKIGRRQKELTLLAIEKTINQKSNRLEFESDLKSKNLSFRYTELTPTLKQIGLTSGMRRAGIQDSGIVSGQINMYISILKYKKYGKEDYVCEVYFDEEDIILSWDGSTVNK